MKDKTGEKILVIEDQEYVRGVIVEILRMDGYTVLEAEDGREGLDVFRREKPDLVFTDLRMPELDGLDVLATISRESPETPVIVVSGQGTLEDAVAALRIGAWDFIIKPIKIEPFLHTARKAFERLKLIKENKQYRENLEQEIKKRTAELEKRTKESEKATKRLLKEAAERKRIEAALKSSEEKYRLLIENQTDMIVKLDSEGKFVFISQSYCDFVKKKEEDLLGQRFTRFIHEKDRETASKAMENLHKPPHTCQMELRILTETGWNWIAWASKAVVKNNNDVEAIVGVGRDITDRKRAEEELQKAKIELEKRVEERTSELTSANKLLQEQIAERMLVETELRESLKRYSQLTQTAHDAIICIREGGIINLWNKSAEKMFGYSREEAMGQKLQDLIVPERYRENIVKGFEQFFETGKGPVIGRTLELTTLRKDGSEFPIELSISVMEMFYGFQATGLIRDITERKRGEEALSTSERNFRNIAENANDGIFIASSDGNILYANKSAAEIVGCNSEELSSTDIKNLISPVDSLDEIGNFLKSLKEDDGLKQFERKVVRRDDSTVHIELALSKTFWKGEEVNLIIIRDITNRVLAMEKSISKRVKKVLRKSYTFERIISKNPEIQRIFDIIPSIAQSNTTVLVVGESGTGKELLVRAIHKLSPRRHKPLVALNCGALPDTLLESELFGYKAGAFTDAKKDKKGYFAQASGSTIFLDEIGDISQALQLKLLRVLQEKTFVPLGANKPIKVDVRVITATNRDLMKMVDEGQFRRDLFYRLNVIQLEMPPLRERKEDIPILIEHFIEKLNQLHGRDVKEISPEALRILMRYDYPGNIRELENIIERALVLCGGDSIQQEHFPNKLLREFIPLSAEAVPVENKITSTLHEFEAQLILSVLKRNNWNRQKSAAELGINRVTLYRKMNKLGIEFTRND